MGKDPAVLLYTGDFLSATQGLTLEEIGQFIKLLCVQHQTGHLSKKAIKVSVGGVSRDVMKFFELDENGLYYNKRLDEEISKRKRFSESRQKNAQKRYEKIAAYASASAVHMENEIEIENINETDIEIDNENETEIEIETGKKYKLDNKIKRKYGEFENVRLTDSQYERLIKKFPTNYERYIDDLSYYIASKGDKYKSHYAAILSWHRGDKTEMSSFDTDDFFAAAIKRSEEHINKRAMEHRSEEKEKSATEIGW